MATQEVGVEVGVRELRNHLSRYLSQVVEGNEFVVTDRGRAIARVVPIAGERTLDRLIAQDLVSPAKPVRRHRPAQRIRALGTVSELVADQRR